MQHLAARQVLCRAHGSDRRLKEVRLFELHQGQFDYTHVRGSVQRARDRLRNVGDGASAVALVPYQSSGPVQDMEPLASLIVHHHLVADGAHEKPGM